MHIKHLSMLIAALGLLVGPAAASPQKNLKLSGTERAISKWQAGDNLVCTDCWVVVENGFALERLRTLELRQLIRIKDRVSMPPSQALRILVKGDPREVASELAKDKFFFGITPALSSDRVHPRLGEEMKSRKTARKSAAVRPPTEVETFTVSVSLADLAGLEGLHQWCVRKNRVFDLDTNFLTIYLSASEEEIHEISGLEGVIQLTYLDQNFPLNDAARRLTNVDLLHTASLDLSNYDAPGNQVSKNWNANRSFSGEGVLVGVYDKEVDADHPDFLEYDPITGLSSSRISGTYSTVADKSEVWRSHGTHVSSIIAGSGVRSELFGGTRFQYRGVAPKSKLERFPTRLSRGPVNGDVNNHSHTGGGGVATEDGNEAYSAPELDNFVALHGRGAKPVVDVFAVGNSGMSSSYGIPMQGYFSILSAPLNSIKVGAVSRGAGKKCPSSSLGPTRDGRLGPDVMAPGCTDLPGWAGLNALVEIDEIEIRNAGTTRILDGAELKWSFTNNLGVPGAQGQWSVAEGTNGWYTGIGFAVQANHTTLTVKFPKTIQVLPDDAIFLKVKVSPGPSGTELPPFIDLIFYQTFGSSGVFRGESPFTPSVGKKVKVDSRWNEIQIASGSTFANSLTLQVANPVTKVFETKTFSEWTGLAFEISAFSPAIFAAEGGIRAGFDDASNGGYFGMAGTSMAAPHVTGIAALMLQKQYLTELQPMGLGIKNSKVWNSTARAILVHTARDMSQTPQELAGVGIPETNPDFMDDPGDQIKTEVYQEGPDWATGYGLVDAKKALDFVDKTRRVQDFLCQNVGPAVKEYSIVVPAGSPKLRVTMAWDDEAIERTNNAANSVFPSPLTVDLDVKLRSPAGTDHFPWFLNPSSLINWGGPVYPGVPGIDPAVTRSRILANKAVKARDSLNNLEVVDVDNPAAGTWKVIVGSSRYEAISRCQDFSVISDFPVSAPPPSNLYVRAPDGTSVSISPTGLVTTKQSIGRIRGVGGMTINQTSTSTTYTEYEFGQSGVLNTRFALRAEPLLKTDPLRFGFIGPHGRPVLGLQINSTHRASEGAVVVP